MAYSEKTSSGLVIVVVLVLGWGCQQHSPSGSAASNEAAAIPSYVDSRVVVDGVVVAKLFDCSKAQIVPADRWKDVEKKMIFGGSFLQLDMTLRELISLLGPAYHQKESLQLYTWYFSDGRHLSMVGLYRLDQKPASISVKEFDLGIFSERSE